MKHKFKTVGALTRGVVQNYRFDCLKKEIEINGRKLAEKKADQVLQIVSGDKFRNRLRDRFPVAAAAHKTKHEIRLLQKTFCQTKSERKALRRFFTRCKRIYYQRPNSPEHPKRRTHLTYPEYIQSPLWTKRRSRYFKKYLRACAACNGTDHIHLHHMVYTAFDGTEPDKNLVPLCETHHDEYHAKHGSSRRMITTTKLFIEQVRRSGNLIS